MLSFRGGGGGGGVGGGGELSRPVYLAPHPPEYESKIILLIRLILIYLIVKMYQS